MQARFLTDKSRLGHLDKDLYYCLDNVLYQDSDGSIYLVPRGFVTDLYSIPNCTAWLVGDSAGRDPRPALVHDFGCAYHQLLKVRGLTVNDLIVYGYLTKHYCEIQEKDLQVCHNIPKEFLQLVDVTKGSVNDLLGRAMECTNIPTLERKKIRAGVTLNFNYFWTGQKYNWDTLYKIANHYKRK